MTQLSSTKDKTTILVNITFIPVFKQAGIDEWRDKMVFLCCDGAAVNVGRKNGVAAKLRVDCVAHRLELGITKAIKDDAKLQRLNEVIIIIKYNIYIAPYSHSALLCCTLFLE